MTIRDAVVEQLPFLRRYARALTGSQDVGDAAVREFLEHLVREPSEMNSAANVRLEIFRVFHRLEHSKAWNSFPPNDGIVGLLPVHARQALLLTVIEEFTVAEAGQILGLNYDDIILSIAYARHAIDEQLSARVMIIEDELIIAMHLRHIVESLDHEITGIARTYAEAVRHAAETQPDLILADISLGDGSSGINAVCEILKTVSVPVIFVTAFPERLLTGAKPEPTYLITKPFEPETVAATIWQALLVYNESKAQQACH